MLKEMPGASSEGPVAAGRHGEVGHSLRALWRYPVKSMAGEDLPAAEITASGLLGDRGYALVDRRNGKVASAKSPEKWGELLNFRALFLTPPRAGERMPGVGITLPDGTVVTSEQEDLGEVLSTVLRREVKLLASAPAGLLL